MMPDLGPYAGSVLGAYGAAALLIGGLILLSLRRARHARRALRAAEKQEGRAHV